MEFRRHPVAKAELLIRKPVAEVFGAFVDPDLITRFWFDKSSGRLEAGQTVQWHWAAVNATAEVRVRAIEENGRILVEWGSGADSEGYSTVEWTFFPRSADTTYVRVVNSGFTGDGDEIVGQALEASGGFALVLAAAKAYLEHGIALNIVADRF